MSEPDSPGPALRDARDAAGLSVSEIASRLKVPKTVVENIEAERFDALPAKVFSHAYIRSYANLVGLDPDEMVSAYDRRAGQEEGAETESRPLGALPRMLAALRKSLRLPRMQSWVFGGTLILFAALAGIFLWFAWPSEAPTTSAPVEQPVEQSSRASSDGDAEPVSTADGGLYESSAPADAPAPSNGLAEPDGPIAQVAQDEAPVPDAAGDAISDASPNDSPDGPAEAPPEGLSEIQQTLASLSNPLTYTPGDEHVLVFNFSSDCWVEVLDAAGGLLHQDLERAGDRLEVHGDAPFSITLGYAPGAQLEYNGDPVMLSQHTHNDVARLVLGL